MLKVAIFDDVVATRGETFNIPGLGVDVYEHADDVVELYQHRHYDVVFMDYAMGSGRKSGAAAIRELRAAGFDCTIVAISSDPSANDEMKEAGADRSLGKKAHLRSYLVHLGETHLRESPSGRS
ncbi:MAG: response regulator [Proteobacteria bacterium]|nr:response regulator [Pseudomonadota bacterium]